MGNIKIFENPEFGKVRTVAIDNEPYFVGKDVAEILGYAKPENAISTHVDEEDKTTTLIQGTGSNYKSNAVLINESGLYSLILSSKLPTAKKFKHWVTSEVLPSIRANGGYIAGQETLSDDELIAKALIMAKNKIAERDKRIAELNEDNERMRPKEIFADAITASKTSILVGELAKILKGNGVDIGQKRLFAWLRDKGYLIKRQGTDYNMPTQKSMELKLFEIKEGSYVDGSGVNKITKTTKVTGKGQEYFINKFLSNEDKCDEVDRN
jgi:anti-repressor protein